MLCVDFIIISNCRNGLIIIIIKIKNVLNICQKVFETSQNSFFVTGKHRNTWSKYKHHHIVQEGGFMGLHYTSVNLTMVGNVSTTTTSTTLEDIEGVRSVKVFLWSTCCCHCFCCHCLCCYCFCVHDNDQHNSWGYRGDKHCERRIGRQSNIINEHIQLSIVHVFWNVLTYFEKVQAAKKIYCCPILFE